MALNSFLMQAAWAIQKNPLVAIGAVFLAGSFIYHKGESARWPHIDDVEASISNFQGSCGKKSQSLRVSLENVSDLEISSIGYEVFGSDPNTKEVATSVARGTYPHKLMPQERVYVCADTPSEKWFNGLDFDEISWQVVTKEVH